MGFTVTHESGVPDSKVIGATSQGWPHILSSLEEPAGDGGVAGGVQRSRCSTAAPTNPYR